MKIYLAADTIFINVSMNLLLERVNRMKCVYLESSRDNIYDNTARQPKIICRIFPRRSTKSFLQLLLFSTMTLITRTMFIQ